MTPSGEIEITLDKLITLRPNVIKDKVTKNLDKLGLKELLPIEKVTKSGKDIMVESGGVSVSLSRIKANPNDVKDRLPKLKAIVSGLVPDKAKVTVVLASSGEASVFYGRTEFMLAEDCQHVKESAGKIHLLYPWLDNAKLSFDADGDFGRAPENCTPGKLLARDLISFLDKLAEDLTANNHGKNPHER